MIHQEHIKLQTRGHRDVHDLTPMVVDIVARSGIQRGLAHVFNIGSTGSVGTIEYEPGLAADLPAVLDHLVPPGSHYGHEHAWHDGNGHSHLQATLMGPSLTVPVMNGRPVLGQWQQVIHLECDVQSHQRAILVTIIGE